jgi:hypothetical protein
MLLKKDGRLVKVRFYDYGDGYMAMASTDECTVMNCFGSTKEAAKDIALFRLTLALNKDIMESGKCKRKWQFILSLNRKAPLNE